MLTKREENGRVIIGRIESPEQKIARLEEENAGMALELVESSIRLSASEQAQADLLLTLVTKGVI